MENLLIALGVPCISGITYLAYRHPEMYKQAFMKKIYWVSGCTIALVFLYNSGIDAALGAVLPLLNKESIDQVTKAITAKHINYNWLLAAIAALFYGGFLEWLAEAMQKEQASKEESQNKTLEN